MKRIGKSLLIVAVLSLAGIFALSHTAFAHCDTLDGPVVQAAKAALEKGDITPVLKWVKKGDEKEIREVFQKVLRARKAGPEAKEIADTHFFETLVRIHRAGEGAPYTGLQAGPPEPIIAAADKALDAGSIDDVIKHVSAAVADGIKKRFSETLEKRKHANASVEEGRSFVGSYVEYTHYLERIHNDAASSAVEHAHGEAAPAAATGHAH